MSLTEKFALAATMLATASPAFAGTQVVPAPVAGAGLGAVLLVGLGYRALKSRIGR
jgi:hypothetical protein